MRKKTGVTWGIILISFGVLFLVGNFIKQSWPLDCDRCRSFFSSGSLIE